VAADLARLQLGEIRGVAERADRLECGVGQVQKLVVVGEQPHGDPGVIRPARSASAQAALVSERSGPAGGGATGRSRPGGVRRRPPPPLDGAVRRARRAPKGALPEQEREARPGQCSSDGHACQP
jgi:hypothetical protein